MDAYDIFKKLTKGLKFKQNILGAKKEKETFKPNESKLKKEEDIIKEELGELNRPNGDDPFSDEIKSEEESSSGDEQSEMEDEGGESSHSENAQDLQLLEGVSVTTSKKKKKKLKEKTENLKEKLELEEQARFRNSLGIRVVGRAVPPALPDLASLATQYGVSERLLTAVTKCGYTEPTPIQRQAWPCMLQKRQILACAPTGSGKTAAFLLPVIQTLTSSPSSGAAPRALVLCPTRELAKQTFREAIRLTEGSDLRCSVLNKITDSKLKERESTFKKSDIVITTPNRLCYLMNQEGVNATLDKVLWLIIDEADKLFEGSEEQESDFRQQMCAVLAACGGRDRRVAMFSATHTPAVAKWARHNMRGLINVTVGQRNAATELVTQELLYCGNEAGKLLAFRQLVQKGLKPPVLVFVQSKDRAKQLFKELIYDGINVDVIHADRTQAQRDNVVRSFRLGKVWVLICTELLARGIDFCGVSLVVNYDFPPSAIAYIHRIGRAGRAGQKGRAVTFFTQDDVNNLRSIAAVMKQSGCEVPAYMLQLKQNATARRKLAKKAPRRDAITTILPSKNKRKLEAEKAKENGKYDASDGVAAAKKAKLAARGTTAKHGNTAGRRAGGKAGREKQDRSKQNKKRKDKKFSK